MLGMIAAVVAYILALVALRAVGAALFHAIRVLTGAR